VARSFVHAVAGAAMLLACTSDASRTPGAGPSPAARESPAGLRPPWVGVNTWGLAASSEVYSCGASEVPQTQLLDSSFPRLRAAGIEVVRFWAFQSHATNPQGIRDWTALDRVFERAESHGIALIPVLGNNWTDCDYWPVSDYPHGGTRKDTADWYRDAFREPYDGYPVSYTAWVEEVTRRYAGRKPLVLWELVNEPRAHTASPSDVDVLSRFLEEARGIVYSVDQRTPVSLGLASPSEPGIGDSRFRELARLADYATVHDYAHADDAVPAGRCTGDCVQTAIQLARLEGKPLYVGESGIDGCDNPKRAQQLVEQMESAFRAGAVGYVFWAYDERATPTDCGFEFGPSSPLLPAILEARTRLSQQERR